MALDYLQTPIEFLKGVGPQRANVLKREFNIFTFGDLLYYFPFRHVDKATVYKISDIQQEGNYMQFRGDITGYQVLGTGRTKRVAAQFTDGTGTMELVWFNGIRWVEDLLAKNHHNVLIFGRPTLFNHHWNMSHPEIIDPNADAAPPSPSIFSLYIILRKRLKSRDWTPRVWRS